MRHTNPQLSESALQRGNFWMSYESGIMWTLSLNHTYPSPNRWGALGRETRRVRGWRRMTFQTLWVGAKSHFCGRKIRIFPYTVTFCPVLYREYSRRCLAQYYRFFTSCTSVSSLITFVQVNLQSETKVVDTLVWSECFYQHFHTFIISFYLNAINPPPHPRINVVCR